MKNFRLLIFGLLLMLFNSCERKIDIVLINPATQASEFSRSLGISGSNVFGPIPTSTPNSGINIVTSASSASVTNGNSLFVPYVFTINTSTQISGIYLQIVGADNYWNIPITISSSSGSYYSYVLDIPIPTNILNGNFSIIYYLYDSKGGISVPIRMNAGIVSTVDYCGSNGTQNLSQVSGSDGITVRSYNFGDTAGWIYIDYNTYSVPDRLDVKYNGDWVASTGNVLKNNETPPIKLCSQVTSGDGFLGTSNTFKIYYDPKKGRRIDIYASGCLQSSTAWDFRVRACPQP